MRFIVELYRLLILAILALALITASFVVFRVIQNPELTTGTSAYVMAAVFVAIVFMILSIGITATIISMHDRLASVAKSAASAADEMESVVDSLRDLVAHVTASQSSTEISVEDGDD